MGVDVEVLRMKGRRSSERGSGTDSTKMLETHITALRKFARALLRGDRDRADDLVQDCLERALANWHRRRPDGNLRSWLYTILYNRFLTEQYRQSRHNCIFTEVVEGDLPHIGGGQHDVLTYRDLVRAFAELPEEQRTVLFLIGVDDFSYAAAAEVLGIPIGTVMSRLSRGRERLRQHMEGDPVRNPPQQIVMRQERGLPKHQLAVLADEP
jgi:RNA polymerase sigma-70 factor, ECF subfamily